MTRSIARPELETIHYIFLGVYEMRNKVMALMLVLGLVLSAVPVLAQVYAVDYLGFGWETGGILPSNAGDELVLTSVADNVDPAFGVDLGSEELTLHIYGLVSTGQVDLGGYFAIEYTGGYLEIYQDSAMNADWGTNPPNPTSPASFQDGALFFLGNFTSFTMYFDATGASGSFSGNLDGVSGSIINGMCTNCVYTWGGTFTQAAGAQIPAGYDLQVDGVFEIDSAVPVQTTNWGSVKALFN